MSALQAIDLEPSTRRYEALLRAANAIARCDDCDTAADVLTKELREVIPFDYLQLIAFENGTNAVGWHLLNSFGQRKKTPLTDPEGTPIAWVHEFQQPLITSDWSRETQFPKHGQFLAELGIPVGER